MAQPIGVADLCAKRDLNAPVEFRVCTSDVVEWGGHDGKDLRREQGGGMTEEGERKSEGRGRWDGRSKV